jgi:sugar transferase (PEP-CTERM system associated)
MLKIFKQYYPIRNILFVIGEAFLIYISMLIAFLFFSMTKSILFDRLLILKIFLITVVCQVSMYYNDLYDLNVADNFTEVSIRLLSSLGVASMVLAFIFLISPMTIVEPTVFYISVGFSILLIVSWRFCYMIILKRGIFNKKTLLLGSGDLAQKIINEISKNKDCGYSLTINFHYYPEETGCISGKNKETAFYDKDNNSICEIVEELDINKIVVALSEKRGKLPTKELLKCRVKGIDIIEGTTFYERMTGKIIVDQINPSMLIFSEGFRKSHVRRFIKLIVDLSLSFVLLILLSPLFILTVVLIKIDSEGPVIFSQERVGKNRKTYLIYKFRSMIADAEKQCGPVWATDDDDRITRIGKIIRKLRVDEIPQLVNVLKGDMSFVGPRPEREFFVNKLESIIPYYQERFTVKPGITGWAQVRYGYGASVEDAIEKLNYDLFYIKNMSISMDLMIIIRTLKIVLFRKGAR